MTTSPLAGDSQIATALTTLGTTALGSTRNELLTQLIVAAANATGGGSGGAAWGDITGTLSAQTDLQAALDAKLALAGGTMTGALTVASGTLTGSAPGLNITQTWNDAAEAFVASEISITKTAAISPAAGDSYFQRFKVGGSVVGGFVNFYDTLAARVREVQLDYKSHGISAQNTTSWNMLCASDYMASVRSTELRLASNVALTWKGDPAPYSGNADTKLPRVSAGILKITNGSDVLGGLQLGTASSSLQVGTHSAIGAETVTGFITIKDSAGNDRKIAVVS